MQFYRWLLCGVALSIAAVCRADPAPFDLAGPSLQVTVTRGTETLPISAVPNLAAGDRLSIRAALPATQSARYLLVAAFLRGATNPPPPGWFFPCETWSRRCRDGLSIQVPAGAQQVLVFLAPKTSGDFKTLMGAVRGRPGAFVRASQDLNQATLDRSRLTAYVASLRTLAQNGQTGELKQAAPLLARSLAIKIDDKCLDRIPELQVPCLMAGEDSLILNDGHSTSIVEALTSAPATDLAMEASYTPQLSYGYYSPYIASVLDIVRIMGSFDSAQYQYIPALASQSGNELALTLNTPPSFHAPRSVLVTALPAVESAQLPPLHAVNPDEMFCARRHSLVLPVEGAPLVFSTNYAREVTLRLTGKDGQLLDLPARADAQQGGFVIDTSQLSNAHLGDSIQGALHGYWGFDAYQGPAFELVNAQAQALSLVGGSEDGTVIVGREATVHLQAVSVGCIEDVMVKDPSGRQLKAEWKTVKLNELEIKLPLQEAKPGALTLLVTQYGSSEAEPVQLHAFSEAGHLDSFTIRAGDAAGVLRGTRLDQVATLTLQGVHFTPGALTSSQGVDQLQMIAQSAPAAGSVAAAPVPQGLQPGEEATARIALKDGRLFDLPTQVAAPRPSVALIGKSVQWSAAEADSAIELAAADQLPQDAKLTFSVRARAPARFERDEQLEVATADGAFSTTLGLANGTVMREDAQVAVATLDPVTAFGPSAFGPLQFRVIEDGVTGDWQPLTTLVRLPRLRELVCPASATLACKLSGNRLFLIDSIASDARFDHPVQVPDGFPGDSLPVPHPADGPLYVRLRDDPSIVNVAQLVAQVLPPSPAESARLAATRAPSPPAPTPPSAPAPAVSPPEPPPPQDLEQLHTFPLLPRESDRIPATGPADAAGRVAAGTGGAANPAAE